MRKLTTLTLTGLSVAALVAGPAMASSAAETGTAPAVASAADPPATCRTA